jgi:23S rRNA (pseudouridine1915-N3)-methyltransferase
MQIVLLAVGRLRPAYREASDDYLTRTRRFADVQEVEVREAAHAPNVAAQQAEEAGRLRERLPRGASVVALAREGSGWPSAELARRVGRWRDGARPLALVIGGSHGLDPAFIAEAEHAWSLGPLTLPHELARVVVAEQVYRAFTILAGMPYHKGR